MSYSVQSATPQVITYACPRRALALGAACTIALLAGATWSAQATGNAYLMLGRRATISTVDAVPLVVSAVLTASLTWATVLVVLSMRALRQHADGAEPSNSLTLPAGLVGRVAAVLLAATLITSTAAAAAPRAFATTQSSIRFDAAPQPSFTDPAQDTPARGYQPCNGPAPSPGWTATKPARASAIGSASAPLVTGCAGAGGDVSEVVVRRGDSLWLMVARHLHTEDPAVIAAQWPRWYAANRAAIGPDPDLIHIGQVLQIPTLDHTSPARPGELR